MRLRSDRQYRFEVGLDELWSRLQDVDSYPQWWPWLREFDGTDLVAGAAWHCTVQPPLPYRVRFVVHLDTVDPPNTVEASVTHSPQFRLELRAKYKPH